MYRTKNVLVPFPCFFRPHLECIHYRVFTRPTKIEMLFVPFFSIPVSRAVLVLGTDTATTHCTWWIPGNLPWSLVNIVWRPIGRPLCQFCLGPGSSCTSFISFVFFILSLSSIHLLSLHSCIHPLGFFLLPSFKSRTDKSWRQNNRKEAGVKYWNFLFSRGQTISGIWFFLCLWHFFSS